MVVIVTTVSSTSGYCAHRQVEDALEAEEQDEGREHGREHRPADEELGEAPRRPLVRRGLRRGAPRLRRGGGIDGVVDHDGAPPVSRFCPAVTTSSPAPTPLGDLDEAERAAAGLDEDLLDRAASLRRPRPRCAPRRPSRRRASSSAPSAAARPRPAPRAARRAP